MSTTYETISQALYDFMAALDISGARPDDWAEETFTWKAKLDRPPKSNELNAYPAFVVMPADDDQEMADTDTDADSVVFSIFAIMNYAEANEAEATLRKIADIMRTKFRELRHDPQPLTNAAYNLSFRGRWGGVPDQGERYYVLDVTVYVHESLIEAP